MDNSVISFPSPANEPVKSYLAGSPERIALDKELERQWKELEKQHLALRDEKLKK